MKPAWSRLKSWGFCALALASALLCGPALATKFSNCRVTSANSISIPVVYDPFAAAATVQVTVSVACVRDDTKNDIMPIWPTLAVENGLYYTGGTRRAKYGNGYLDYGLWQDSGASVAWDATSMIEVPLTWNNLNGTGSATFYFKLPAGQNQGVGTPYTDSAAVTLYHSDRHDDKRDKVLTVSNAAIVAPSITIAPGCRLSSTPGDLTFSYTSFQVAPAQASTSFAAKCVKDTSYTMALDATSGTLLGLNYSLAISPTGQRTGSGVDQSVTISGTIAADQSGTCATSSCTARQSRTFTITY